MAVKQTKMLTDAEKRAYALRIDQALMGIWRLMGWGPESDALLTPGGKGVGLCNAPPGAPLITDYINLDGGRLTLNMVAEWLEWERVLLQHFGRSKYFGSLTVGGKRRLYMAAIEMCEARLLERGYTEGSKVTTMEYTGTLKQCISEVSAGTLDRLKQREELERAAGAANAAGVASVANAASACVKAKRKVFTKPAPGDVAAYFKERGSALDPEAFYLYYEGNGWMAGKVKMADWKAAARGWILRQREFDAARGNLRGSARARAPGARDFLDEVSAAPVRLKRTGKGMPRAAEYREGA